MAWGRGEMKMKIFRNWVRKRVSLSPEMRVMSSGPWFRETTGTWLWASQNTLAWGSFRWPSRRTFLQVAQPLFANTEQTRRRQGAEETGNEERGEEAKERWVCSQKGN